MKDSCAISELASL